MRYFSIESTSDILGQEHHINNFKSQLRDQHNGDYSCRINY